MRLFNGTELVFPQTYFPTKCDRVLEIKTDTSVRSLALTEVPETAGSFSLPDDGSGFQNRIIFWRTDGSTLFLTEVCANRDFSNTSLCISFAPAPIIRGTHISVVRDLFVLVVPTQSCVHRFRVRLAGQSNMDKNFTARSVLSFFPPMEQLGTVHDCHYFGHGLFATAVHITHDSVGNAQCAVALNRSQMMMLTMKMQSGALKGRPFLVDSLFLDTYEENHLKEGFGLRLWGNVSESPIMHVATVCVADEIFVVAVHENGKLKIWSCADHTVKFTYSVSEFLKKDAVIEVEDVQLKFVKEFCRCYLIMKVQLVMKAKFVFFEFDSAGLTLRNSVDLDGSLVVDFALSKASKSSQAFALWACNRESYEDSQDKVAFQPYSMFKTFVTMTEGERVEWEKIEGTAPRLGYDRILYKDSLINPIKKRLFDGEMYSFENVRRAIQTICKSPGTEFEYLNWQRLSQFADGFVESGQFKKLFLTAEDQQTLTTVNAIDDARLKAARLKYYRALEKCCSQFQEQHVLPIAMWHCPVLGLARFTVYLQADEQMKGMAHMDQQVLEKFVQFTQPYLSENSDFRNVSIVTVKFLTENIRVLLRVLRWFTARNPTEVVGELAPLQNQYLDSTFSVGLLANALRHRILSRLLFSKSILTLISLVESQFTKTDTIVKSSGDLHLEVIDLRSPLAQVTNYYNTLWHSLSFRFLDRDPSSSAHLVARTVAQCYVKQGGHVRQLATDPDELMDDDMDETGDVYERWEREAQRVRPRFLHFSLKALTDAIIALWPNSPSMAFPHFLAKNRFYQQLREYCSLNEPYVANLCSAFNFFNGVALSGLGQPEEASLAFENASQGVEAGDEALNRALCIYTRHKYPYTHTFAEFYNALMVVFKADHHSDYVTRCGRFALQFAEDSAKILPQVYNTLFSQHVADHKYYEAIRVIHQNPSAVNKKSCLRTMIGTLLDRRETKDLVDLHYGELTADVAEMLETRCKTQSPQAENGLYNVVYAFYMKRYSYEAAARVMFELAWRLKLEVQSRDLLEKRCRLLACVCHTVQMMPNTGAVLFEFNTKQFSDKAKKALSHLEEAADPVVEAENLRPTRTEVQNEFLILEARLALMDQHHFAEGPPVDADQIYAAAITFKNYDLAFVLQRNFQLPLADLIHSLTLDCFDLGFQMRQTYPSWVTSNRRFVDGCGAGNDLAPQWRLLVSYVDLATKTGQQADDKLVLRDVLDLFLERAQPVPDWLKQRYVRLNVRDFLTELLEFDQVDYALVVVCEVLEQSLKRRISPSDLHAIPFIIINSLLQLAQTKDHQRQTAHLVTRTRNNLKKVVQAARMTSLIR